MRLLAMALRVPPSWLLVALLAGSVFFYLRALYLGFIDLLVAFVETVI